MVVGSSLCFAMGKTLLSPGFRFHPTDVELVKYYLKRKILGRKFHFEAISEVEIYKYAPWDLPDKSCLQSKDLKWYFFCPREKKYASGARMNRATEFGYWKTTGKDRPVNYNGEVVGMIKTLVFHRGRAPKGDRTDWVMHEYRLEEQNLADRGFVQDSYVLCMLFKKEGLGPRNGAQYGAPFREEDWTDDDDDDHAAVPSAKITLQKIMPPNGDYVASSSRTFESISHVFSPESCVSDIVQPSSEVTLAVPGNGVPAEKVQSSNDEDKILDLLEYFVEGGPFEMNANDINKDDNNVNHDNLVAVAGAGAPPDGKDIFEDLDDLGNLADGFGFSSSHKATRTLDELFDPADDNCFMELMDLDAPLSRPTGASIIEGVQLDGLCAALNCCPDAGQSSDQVDTCSAVRPSLWPDVAHN